jgi:hypothetical protein
MNILYCMLDLERNPTRTRRARRRRDRSCPQASKAAIHQQEGHESFHKRHFWPMVAFLNEVARTPSPFRTGKSVSLPAALIPAAIPSLSFALHTTSSVSPLIKSSYILNHPQPSSLPRQSVKPLLILFYFNYKYYTTSLGSHELSSTIYLTCC